MLRTSHDQPGPGVHRQVLVATARDQHQRLVVVGFERGDRPLRSRGDRIVHEPHSVTFGDGLQAMRYALERADRGGHSFAPDPRGVRRR